MDAVLQDLWKAGDLNGALKQSASLLRRAPNDTDARLLHAMLLAFNGESDKADLHFEFVSRSSLATSVPIRQLRQYLRADQKRMAVFETGALPDFLAEPPEHLRLTLKALIAARNKEWCDAKAAIEEAERRRPDFAVRLGDRRVEDFRDLDDLLAGVIEVLGGAGEYYWIPLDMVRTLVIKRPRLLIDLLWLEADIEVEGSISGTVRLPAMYPAFGEPVEPTLRLGRATDWVECPEAIMRGRGQRTFVAGGEALAIGEISNLSLAV